mmetsp:Transcript_14506/g.41335  ORF Transcript_14506/g.41335 Transcript_14506/m.41335 type:complete len:110 (+) Transcript_14506:1098-1427(+)
MREVRHLLRPAWVSQFLARQGSFFCFFFWREADDERRGEEERRDKRREERVGRVRLINLVRTHGLIHFGSVQSKLPQEAFVALRCIGMASVVVVGYQYQRLLGIFYFGS